MDNELDPSGTKWCKCQWYHCLGGCVVPQPFLTIMDLHEYHHHSSLDVEREPDKVRIYTLVHHQIRAANTSGPEEDGEITLPKVQKVVQEVNVHACGSSFIFVGRKGQEDYGLAWQENRPGLQFDRDTLRQEYKAMASALAEMESIQYQES